MLPADRLLLEAVATGEPDLHGARSLEELGRSLGLGRAADRSVTQNALKRLRERQVLIQTETGVYRYEDETFKDRVLAQQPDKHS